MDFYYFPMSAPCRAVQLAAKAIGVELNLKTINPMTGETKTPEFLKMNIQHTIPTLNDNGFCLNESRAICQYLANKYGKEDSLYPKDPQARAEVDMKLFFDMGTLYSRFATAYYPAAFGGAAIKQEEMDKLDEALGFLEEYLKDGYVAGNHLTIADFAILSTISTIEACGHDFSKFTKVQAYLEMAKKEVEGYEELNQAGADGFGSFVKPKLGRA